MSVEVRQMIVNSTLVSGKGERDMPADQGLDGQNLQKLKEQLIEECREMIEQSLDRSRER